MSYLYINLYSQRDRANLDPEAAVLRLQKQFPEAIVLPGGGREPIEPIDLLCVGPTL